MTTTPTIQIQNIIKASNRLNDVIAETPLQHNLNLSEKYEANIFLKREDLQMVRSYKIRGAYNFMVHLSAAEKAQGIVCASAGNHAQGVAHSCKLLQIKGEIYMPSTTPLQKINRVEKLGKSWVKVILIGDTFDEANKQARSYAQAQKKVFVHPFEDALVIAGQGTVGAEILNQFKKGDIDFLFAPVGGGGLSAGVGTYFQTLSPSTQIIGVEPEGAPAMHQSLAKGEVVTLDKINTFVDGAAVKQVGSLNFAICRQILKEVCLVPEGKVCSHILSMYNEDAIVVEPAGVLSVAALDFYKDQIKGKNIVCIISGGNNDIERMPEIKERSLVYEGLKHYFIVKFPQRAGALRDFLDNVLGPNDDITTFEYTKKTSRNSGPALVGIELKDKNDYAPLVQRMKDSAFEFMHIDKDSDLFSLLI